MKLDLQLFMTVSIVALFVLYAPIGVYYFNNPDVTGVMYDRLSAVYGFGRRALGPIVVGVILLSPTSVSSIMQIRPLWPTILLTVFSIAWTESFKTTWQYALDFFCLMIWATGAIQIVGIAKFLRWSGIVTGIAILASVASAVLPPHMGIHHATDVKESIHAGRWRGVFLNKNGLGEFATTTLILCLGQAPDKRLLWRAFWWCCGVSAAICVVLSGSSTSQMGALVAVAAFLALSYRPLSRPVPLLLIAVTAGVLVPTLLSTDAVANFLGRDSTFSGRTVIWSYALSMIQSHLWFGYGASSADDVFAPSAEVALFPGAGQTHSGYLDMFFGLGIVGLSLLGCSLLYLLIRGYLASQRLEGDDRRYAITYVSLVISACVIAVGETSPFRCLGDGATALWTGLVALCHIKLPNHVVAADLGARDLRPAAATLRFATPARAVLRRLSRPPAGPAKQS